ncbi:MAG: peptidoglycan-binding domain-containing protein [Candidatus Nomurabacteria bacterium]
MYRIIFLFFLLIIPNLVSASTTDGIIDSTYHYAWSENAGWIDFGSSAGNVHITDTAITGSVYGENIGWIILNPQTYGGVTNNTEGTLSGYAWSENAGWIDFSHVIIGSDGVFTGGAYSPNIGWITFGVGDNKVLTDWRPYSTRNPTPNRGTGGGSSGSYFVNPLTAVAYIPPISMTALNAKLIPVTPPRISISTDSLNTPKIKTLVLSEKQFFHNLTVMSIGEDVKQLQHFLNTHGFAVAHVGVGSLGKESSLFGPATQKALIKFQKANNITPATGYFGSKTRDYIKKLAL